MKILLVEDEADWGLSIYRILNQEKYIVDWVQDGVTAWNYLDSHYNEYTLTILDWALPGLTGLELCTRLRQRQNPLPVLFLIKQECWEDGIIGLDAGADDYITKPFRHEELLARLRALRRRSPYFQPSKLQFGRLTLDCDSRMLNWQSDSYTHRSMRLSKKQFQLLEYFLKHSQKAIRPDQLLNYLYEAEAERNSNVIAAQVHRLRRRLAELGCDNIIQTLPGGFYQLNRAYED